MNLPRVDTLLINANRTNGKQLRTGEEAVEYLKPYFENAKTPSIHLVQLNVQCKILRSNIITVKAFENHHREILSDLLLNNAQQVIVCDNYKNIAKSQKLSNKIKEYLKYPQIRLIDYINLYKEVHLKNSNYGEDIYYSSDAEINLNSRYIEQNIKLVEEGYLDVKSGSLSDTLDSLYEDLRKRTREEVVTLNIDEDLKPINYIVSSIGTIDRSLASSFELLKGSIMSGARNVILLHNHPSGSNYPSKGDIEMTRKVQEAYNFMGINFYDHHIVGSKVYSFKENGLLDEMRDKQSVKFEKDIKIKKNKEKGAEKKMEILNSKFNDLQLEQTRLGLEEDLDISKYADPKFSSHQMDEIQYGLSEELDISKYADPKFNSMQMSQIRLGLKKGLDVSRYADPKFDWSQMEQIRYGLEDGLDISKYTDSKFDEAQMAEIRYRLKGNSDISRTTDSKFDNLQMAQIQIGLSHNLDVSKYADPNFDHNQMYEIRLGLENGLDISKYADPKFSPMQMEQIRYGLRKELDVSKYADLKFNYKQMRSILTGLEDGLDISKYADPKFSSHQM
ncbi:JAB domain-containing protein, partial [Fusobacterium gonidiaformans]|uniref:JAB domain-containing protein n=1 Tax=Fusobacterium gonidiaformans TaxID=849 RepID=UPI0023F301A6